MAGSTSYGRLAPVWTLRRRFVAVGVSLLLVATSVLAQQGPPLRVAVNRVNVGVTVTDSRGRFVAGLARKDFRIYDNGVEQPVVDFLPVEEPAQFLMLVESGPSVYLFSKNHVLAADKLLTSISADDRVAIAIYSRRPELVLDFTADKAAARLALRSIDFRSGFGELDLLSTISSAIEALAPLPGKKTIVLLSTGLDTSPSVQWETLEATLETSDVRIISVSVAGDIRRPAKQKHLSAEEQAERNELKSGFAAADASLGRLSRVTGGRVYFARTTNEFERAYAEIAELLRFEYSLSFAPQVFDGKVHNLRVEVARHGVRVDHRPAYLAANTGGNAP
jgi:Ca-activated chloride channel family protein